MPGSFSFSRAKSAVRMLNKLRRDENALDFHVRSLLAAFLDFFLPSLTLCLILARCVVVPRLLVSVR